MSELDLGGSGSETPEVEYKAPVELEWYDFETRMRAVVTDLIEPILKRGQEDREEIGSCNRSCATISKRLEDLEFLVQKNKGRNKVMDDINRRIAASDTERKLTESRFKAFLDKLEAEQTKVRYSNSIFERQIAALEERNTFLEKEVKRANESLIDHKQTVVDEFRQFTGQLETTFAEVKDLNFSAEEIGKECVQKCNDAEEHIRDLLYYVEGSKTNFIDVYEKIRLIEQSKISIEDCNSEIEKVIKEVNLGSEEYQAMKAEVQKLLSYTDKILPITMQNLISDSLYNTLDNEALNRYMDIEKTVMDNFSKVSFTPDYDISIAAIIEKVKTSQQTRETKREERRLEMMEEDNNAKIAKEEKDRKKKEDMEEQIGKLTALAEQAASKRTMADFPIHDHNRPMGGLRRDDSSAASSVARSRRASRRQGGFRRQDSSVSSSSRGTSVVSEMDNQLGADNSVLVPPPQFREGNAPTKGKSKAMVNEGDMIQENEEDLASISDGSESFHSAANSALFREIEEMKTSFQTQLEEVKENCTKEITICKKAVSKARKKQKAFEEKILKRVSRLRKDMYQGDNETRIHVETFHNDLEQMKNLHDSELKAHSERVDRILSRSEHINNMVESCQNDLKQVLQITSASVEAILIMHALLISDEIDKNSIQLTGYREGNEKMRPSLNLEAECLTWSGQPAFLMQSFKMACLTYSPSPLMYRNKPFQRRELLDVMGNMITTCWDGVLQNEKFAHLKQAAYHDPHQSHYSNSNAHSPVRSQRAPSHVKTRSLNTSADFIQNESLPVITKFTRAQQEAGRHHFQVQLELN